MSNLVSQIESGVYDKELVDLQKALENRIVKLRAGRTIKDFNIGDRVVFNNLTGTRYMVGQYATIVSKRQKKLVVKLETPMGRFAKIAPNGQVISSEVVVPVSIIDAA